MFVSVRINRLFGTLLAVAVLASGLGGGSVAAVKQVEAHTVQVPIVMYHSILRESGRQGNYVVSPKTLESDLAWLRGAGCHTIVVQDLLDYVYRQKPLPEKPVMLTFDDGYYNNYFYAYPLAKKYDSKIVVSPVGYYTDLFTGGDADHANYSYLTWGEIGEMMHSGAVEIQSHSYNLHSTRGRLGAQKLRWESVDAYTSLLRRDLLKMQDEMQENTGYEPTAFVYPFGAVSPESVPILKELGFQASLTCRGKTNRITQNPECLFGLGRYLRPAGVSSDTFFRKLGLK